MIASVGGHPLLADPCVLFFLTHYYLCVSCACVCILYIYIYIYISLFVVFTIFSVLCLNSSLSYRYHSLCSYYVVVLCIC